jgi:hypothetical protein
VNVTSTRSPRFVGETTTNSRIRHDPSAPILAATCSGIQGPTSGCFRQFRLKLPRGMRPEPSQIVFEHGGRRWAGDSIDVSIALGYFAPYSFDSWIGTRCRAEIDGRIALVIERAAETGGIVLVWTPEFRLDAPTPYEAVVSASSSRQQDLPMLRSIALSLKMSEP